MSWPNIHCAGVSCHQVTLSTLVERPGHKYALENVTNCKLKTLKHFKPILESIKNNGHSFQIEYWCFHSCHRLRHMARQGRARRCCLGGLESWLPSHRYCANVSMNQANHNSKSTDSEQAMEQNRPSAKPSSRAVSHATRSSSPPSYGTTSTTQTMSKPPVMPRSRISVSTTLIST